MTKAQWTDFIRAIKKSKGRYISLIFIVALGTAFFTGVRSAEPDMIASADKYYDDSNLMDVRVLGTLGLTEEDLAAISDTEGIYHAEGGYATELLAVAEGDRLVVNVMSQSENLNQMTLEKGRMPESPDECFLDAGVMTAGGYQIGDTITLTDEDGSVPDALVGDSFTIVGSGTWSWYLSWTRGSASIGDGSLDGFMVVPEEAFDLEYYTVIYATVQGVETLSSFSDSYKEAVDLVTDRIKEIAGDRCYIRYSEIYEDAQQIIDDAKQKIADGEQELQDAEQSLKDAEEEYAEGLESFKDGKAAYEDGLTGYQEGKDKLEQAKKDLEAGKAEYEDGLKAYQEAEQTLGKSKQELDSKKQELDAKSTELAEAEQEYAEAKETLDQAEAYLAEQEQELTEAQAQYQAAQATYEEKEAELQEAKTSLDSGWQAVNEAEAMLSSLKTQMDQIEAEQGTDSDQYKLFYTLWSEGNSQLNQQKVELEKKQAEYDDAAAQMAAAKKKLDETAVQLEEGQAQLEAAKQELAEKTELLAEKRQQLDSANAQLKEGSDAIAAAQQEIESGEKTLQEKKEQLDSAGETIKSGEQTYNENAQKLKDSLSKLENSKEKLEKAETELKDARQELDDGWLEYEEEAQKAGEQLEKARQEVADGEQKLAELEEGEWYVLGRDSIQTSVEYSLDAERVGAIGDVLPVIFFLVAALVSLTTMTRMVEEERTLIGTMKALGYGKFSIAAKYILYALSATLIGGILGVVIGSKFLPYVIMIAYGMLYSNVQYKLLPLHMDLCVSAISLAMLCTVGAAFFACYKELLSTPAALMRPPAPKQGKRVFLEYFPSVWNRLNFSMKATIRNLVRYKKRFFMTVFGIGGCMAILLACFGLRDSISVIAKNQYTSIWTYSASCGIDEDMELEQQKQFVDTITQEQPEIQSGMLGRKVTVDVSTELAAKTIYLYVVEDPGRMQAYLNMHDRITQEPYTLTDDGVILTEKLANTLGVAAGDTFVMNVSSTEQKNVTVTAITENYTSHCVYMTAGLYETLYEEAPKFNQLYLLFEDGLKEARQLKLAEYLMGDDTVTSVTLVEQQLDSLNDMVGSLNLVVWVLIVAAGLLAFVVLFNLNNINISERRRELATLKVLGFFDDEVAMYVYRENIILTVFGIILGLFLGTWLHQYLVSTLEVDLIMFGREVTPLSYVWSVLLTILFALLVNAAMYKKLQQIDMIESLKSVE